MVRKADRNDLDTLTALALLLWPDNDFGGLKAELTALFEEGNTRYFLKIAQDEPVGFAQCSLRRDYVEGTSTSPVGYLEGIFVKENFRNRGYAKELVAACESWAREQGCSEFASDVELENTVSQAFHRALKFEEAGRIVCFVKKIH